MSPRAFAVVPAAGTSQRMGKPKLLLPWHDSTIIDAVLDTWKASTVSRIVVVVRAEDSELIERCRTHDIDLVVPRTSPPDMKASVRSAIDHLQAEFQPQPEDAWLLAPADMPGITATHVQRLIDHNDQCATSRIVVPTYHGHRGHPVLFSWEIVKHLPEIPATAGLNWLLENYPVHELPLDDPQILLDIDTPDDYRQQLPTQEPPSDLSSSHP